MATMKALEDVLSQIDHIRHIASRWSASEAVSDMERELMLDKLRALYEEVLFLDWEPGEEEAPEGQTAAAAAPTDALPNGTPAQAQSAARSEAEPPTAAAQPVAAIQPVAAALPIEPVAAAPEVFGDEQPEAPLAEPLAQEEPFVSEPETVVWSEQTVTTVSETTDQKLFSDEPHVRTRVDKQVILSLYGEGAPASASRPFTGSHQPAPRPQERSYEPEIGAQSAPSFSSAPAAASAPRRDVHAPAAIGQNGHGPKVLGEVIGGSGESLGDRLGKQHSHADVASKLRSSTITDLQRSIGINDRFLLINELFGGDVARYEQILSRLNEFTALDDAMIYIQENFDWNPDSEGATFLVELLERKLEN